MNELSLNRVWDKQLSDALHNFIKEVGIGQYSHYRAAQYLVEDYPDLVAEIVLKYLIVRDRQGNSPWESI